MKVTNQSICAVEALADLVIEGGNRPRTTQAIADRIGRSVSYVEQILAKLRDAGLVKGERGPGGGYILQQPPHRIAIADIVQAIEPPGRIVHLRRMNGMDAGAAEKDGADLLWEAVEHHTREYLSGIVLADILRAPLALGDDPGRLASLTPMSVQDHVHQDHIHHDHAQMARRQG